MTELQTLVTIAGLMVITFITRGFFVLPEREFPIPAWLKEGLRYAPIGALVAVVAPDLLLHQGELLGHWRDARLFGAAAAVAWYAWRRDMLGTIVVGTAVMLILRIALGW